MRSAHPATGGPEVRSRFGPHHRLSTVAALAAAVFACKVKDPPPITERWTDDFERSEIGRNYLPTSEAYRVSAGALTVKGAHNHPMWLRKKLPHDVSIELDVWSESSDGDLKVELFGDGESYDRDRGGYTSTGYVLVMGGWKNSRSILARGDEHGTELAERRAPRVEVGRRYHWKIVRRGELLEWYVDDMTEPFLRLSDPAPLYGDRHAYFGFNNWAAESWFDNLSITPL